MFGKGLIVIWAAAFVLLWAACGNAPEYYETKGEVFKTGFHVKYKHTRVLGMEIVDCLKDVDMSLNPFNSESVIYKVNNNLPVEVDDLFIAVFRKAMEVSEVSGGRYDITCAPLINLWGFGFERMDSVNGSVIDSLREFVGFRKVRLDGRRVVKDDPRVQLNASSIAKGYACDVVAGMFDSIGVCDYMVEIGGEVRARGKNARDVCWRVEIPKPLDDCTGLVNERLDVVELCDRSIATSGNYRNYYVRGGRKYAHTIDPLTGYPAVGNILSASVLADDCMTADAFATAFMTMNPEMAADVARRVPGLGFIFVYSDGDGGFGVLRSD
jgi:thiamine biosynthesis lipoprotein